MDLASLKQAHAMVIEEETTATALHKVVAYQRGSVYIRERNFASHDLPLKIFYFIEFGVNYKTVQRYLLFAMLIRLYPRSIIYGLSFTQLSKHHNRIVQHLRNIILVYCDYM
jgi:hypothetical protein